MHTFHPSVKYLFFNISFLLLVSAGRAQTGGVGEPVRYVGGQTIDPDVHEGRIRYAVGVENIQTMRSNRSHPDSAEGYGWTYNHASNLCYWNLQFFQQYLSNPVDEHIAPGQTLLIRSVDGRHWGKPVVVFPPYKAPDSVAVPEGYHGYMMHQRMGFYIAPSQRMLVLGFYGHAEDPFGKGGIGRVVREAYRDGSFGPIYFIRYESAAGWNASNTSMPYYTSSSDTGFVAACQALLQDPLKTFQWYEEDPGLDGFYHGKKGAQAFNYYHRKDGKIVGLWKKSLAALSDDGGKTFSEPVKNPTFLMSGGKQWGQQTSDGRYAIVYNPIESSEYRYPMVIVTGDDGIIYDHMLLIQGEVPPRRFSGRWKDFGPCYMRGMLEGDGVPPGKDMWLSYTMNKEDVWISRIPVPVTYRVTGPVNDDFDKLPVGGPIPDWNVYAPAWAPVSIVPGSGGGKVLELRDREPYDYARAIRVFEEGRLVDVQLDIRADSANTGRLEVELADQFGNRPVRLVFDEAGEIVVTDGGHSKKLMAYSRARWYKIRIKADASLHGSFDVWIDGSLVARGSQLAEAVNSVERLSLRTGAFRNTPNRLTPNETNDPPLAGCDEPSAPVCFQIDNVRIGKAVR